MLIFLDSADTSEIAKAASLGLCDGVTTNPTIIMKQGADHYTRIREICDVLDGPVMAEPSGLTTGLILKEGRELRQIADNVVVKIPISMEGMEAIRTLTDEGIDCAATLVFTPTQALAAAKAGARYIAPFVGRLDDISTEGMEMIRQVSWLYQSYEIPTQIIVASVRHPMHVVQAAEAGADGITVPFSVLPKLIAHPLTDRGIQQFAKDAAKGKGG